MLTSPIINTFGSMGKSGAMLHSGPMKFGAPWKVSNVPPVTPGTAPQAAPQVLLCYELSECVMVSGQRFWLSLAFLAPKGKDSIWVMVYSGTQKHNWKKTNEMYVGPGKRKLGIWRCKENTRSDFQYKRGVSLCGGPQKRRRWDACRTVHPHSGTKPFLLSVNLSKLGHPGHSTK